MCNLNILLGTEGKDVSGILNLLTAPSFISNDDMEGAWFNGNDELVHQKSKIDYTTHKKAITGSDCIMTHQRRTTSGEGLKNCHPFANRRYVLVHNGIVNWTKQSKGLSDTAVLFKRLTTHLQKKNMKEAIEATLSETEGGWWSIFVYDKLKKKGWYFKNYWPQINIGVLKNGITFVCTNNDSLKLVDVEAQYTIGKDVLYLIEDTPTGVDVLERGKLEYKTKPIPKKDWTKSVYGGYRGYDSYQDDDYGATRG